MTVNFVKDLTKLGIAVALLATFGLAACNTVEGAGKDVKATGKAIEDTAKDAKDDNK